MELYLVIILDLFNGTMFPIWSIGYISFNYLKHNTFFFFFPHFAAA